MRRFILGWKVLGYARRFKAEIVPVNPAAAVRGPKHVVTKGATPVLSPSEARKLLESIDTGGLEESKAALFQTVDPAGRRLTGRALERRVLLAACGETPRLRDRQDRSRALHWGVCPWANDAPGGGSGRCGSPAANCRAARATRSTNA